MVLIMGKYCANCGQPLEDDAKFCDKCGKVQDTDAAAMEQVLSDHKIPDVSDVQQPVQVTSAIPDTPVIINQGSHTNWGKRILLGIGAVILCVILLGIVSGGGSELAEDKYVKLVKTGTLQMAPNNVIGKSFENFFGDCKWKSFISKDDKKRVVEFNGTCTWKDKPAKCTIQFLIKNNREFELGAVAINDVDMNRFEAMGIVEKALTNHGSKKK